MADEGLIRPNTIVEDLQAFVSKVHDHFESSDKSLRFKLTESSGNGKWGMARLWRSWMDITAEHMAANGAVMPLMIDKHGNPYGTRKFNAQDAHELFTSQWLGLNEKGERLSWKKSEGDNVADKGQRYIAMMKHQNWCIEKGINLPVPRNSEYRDLENEQNSMQE